jgi:ABC transport system ATP-binding/permease protein
MKYEKEKYILALDLVIETLINHQKENENITVLHEIVRKYDEHFETKEFSQSLIQKLSFYKNQLTKENESLFINDYHIPYILKNNILVTDFEIVEVYIIILFWIRNFHLINESIFFKLAQNLCIENTEAEKINQFIFELKTIRHQDFYFRELPGKRFNFEQLEGEWVESNKPHDSEMETNFEVSDSDEYLDVLFLPKYRLFLVLARESTVISIKPETVIPDVFVLMNSGDNIILGSKRTISYSYLKRRLVENKYGKKTFLTAKQVEISDINKVKTKPFNLIGETGELIGVIGKDSLIVSSFLKLLSGFSKPQSGSVFVNGYDINKFNYQLSGLIGYVGKEDILVPELSVYDNLAMAIRLFIKNSSDYNIKMLVNEVLNEIGLSANKDLIVGPEHESKLKAGQRRLLNIALELIRDPLILIIEDAKYPLSMGDASMVIEILSKLTLNGKLVITSIVQGNSAAFEKLDKIFIFLNDDKSTYFGENHSALCYFKENLDEGFARNLIKTDKVDYETFYNLLDPSENELKNKDFSHQLNDSKITNNAIAESLSPAIDNVRQIKKIPSRPVHPPRLEKQFLMYSIRNFKTKIALGKNLAYTLLSAPIIALILSFIFRTSETKPYSFESNLNIPDFFYLGILTNIFLGLIISVNEINKERNILKKEMFMNLSLFSYINSKVFYLLIIVLLQTFMFTVTANLILSIHSMNFYHWIIYFSCGTFGSLLGLILSSVFQNQDTLTLRVIPFLIIILLLFGCGWIPPSHLNISKNKYSPLISSLMVNRWAYEAIVVKQFTDNPYQINFNIADEKISNGSFNLYNVLPLLQDLIEKQNYDSIRSSDSIRHNLKIISNRFKLWQATENIYPFEFTDSLAKGIMNKNIEQEAFDYLTYLEYYFNGVYKEGLRLKQTITDSLNNNFNYNYVDSLRNQFSNRAITQHVRNSSLRKNLLIIGDEIIQQTDPIFCKPVNNMGRSQLFQMVKKFNSQFIDTYEFNLSIIWLFNLLCYVLLITNLINRIIGRIR